MNNFKVSYVTTLPKEGNAPRLTITGNQFQTYRVYFYESHLENYNLISSGLCTTNQTIIAKAKQWFTEWFIRVVDENNNIVFTDVFNPEGKVVFIKMDAYALGDSIAWIPYVDIFRRKHQCKVICSTFHNYLFVNSYPDIMFVKPNTVIENVYAQYYIGAMNEDNPYYSPIKVNENPLQAVASSILGLKPTEERPSLENDYNHFQPRINKKYVTLSEYGSGPNKHWRLDGGWQKIVDYLITCGYEILVISKEPTSLQNVTNLTGDISLQNRAIDILNAQFHLGVSSGLSWLAWALGTHVIMISDVTPNWHEFQSNITRLNANNLTHINYDSEGVTSIEEVIKKLGELGVL